MCPLEDIICNVYKYNHNFVSFEMKGFQIIKTIFLVVAH